MGKEHLIWSNLDLNPEDDDWKESYREHLEMNNLSEDDISLEDYVEETNAFYLDDERQNLDIECDGKILAIADLGLWNGRHQGFQIINKKNVNGIFHVGVIDRAKFYCDQYNVRAEMHHHDGCNYILFREIRPNVNIDTICQRIYNGEEIDSKTLSRYTKSLRPYVKKAYGF